MRGASPRETDKRGTWSYHSVDGWYMSTSPEHDRTHTCHVKETRSERLTDTVQFGHKNITNPTLTHADKIMQAISACANALKGTSNGGTELERRQMEQLQQLANKAVEQGAIPASAIQPTGTREVGNTSSHQPVSSSHNTIITSHHAPSKLEADNDTA